ncbi:MAG: hypothetical protein ACIPMY_06475 [Rickettsia endosymbiont of Pentastiridius leporinus]
MIDLLSDSSVTNNLYSQKIDLDQISQLSNQDLEKAKFLLSNYDVIKENFLNKDSKLTPEDLKKCNLADIQNLAKGTITAEQLKTSLTEKAPVGKWVAKVQEGRQTIAKETKGSQR